MTQPQPLDLDEISACAAYLATYAITPPDATRLATEAVPAMADEIRRLRAELAQERENYQAYRIGAEGAKQMLANRVAELEEERPLEWQLSHARNPHTPLLCKCGHSHFAHIVAAPHSCVAFGNTCPCEAYQQLPHDEAVAQLERNRQAAAASAAARP